MNPYYNLPSEQRRGQLIAEQFNADEQLWRNLRSQRLLRRKLYPRLSAKQRRQLDLLEFAAMHPAQDCVGRFIHT